MQPLCDLHEPCQMILLTCKLFPDHLRVFHFDLVNVPVSTDAIPPDLVTVSVSVCLDTFTSSSRLRFWAAVRPGWAFISQVLGFKVLLRVW